MQSTSWTDREKVGRDPNSSLAYALGYLHAVADAFSMPDAGNRLNLSSLLRTICKAEIAQSEGNKEELLVRLKEIACEIEKVLSNAGITKTQAELFKSANVMLKNPFRSMSECVL